MVKSFTKTQKLIRLELTEKEARWLKDLTQNYLGGGEYPFSEKPEARKIREDIFTSLNKSLKNKKE